MSESTRLLVLTAHLIGVVLWVSGLTTIYWMLRFHDHAPKEVHEKLTLMERAMALSTDIAATVTIGCGIALALSPVNLFATKGNGWLHVKLAAVILGILSVHGILRARIKRYSRGELKPVPTWAWSLLLAGVAISIFAVVTRLNIFH
ncbi:MAG: CopD family protein [Acidobacteriota bacterium]